MGKNQSQLSALLDLISFLILIALWGASCCIAAVSVFMSVVMIWNSLSKAEPMMTIQGGFVPVYLFILAVVSSKFAMFINNAIEKMMKGDN